MRAALLDHDPHVSDARASSTLLVFLFPSPSEWVIVPLGTLVTLSLSFTYYSPLFRIKGATSQNHLKLNACLYKTIDIKDHGACHGKTIGVVADNIFPNTFAFYILTRVLQA
jgi:hypothetical protein